MHKKRFATVQEKAAYHKARRKGFNPLPDDPVWDEIDAALEKIWADPSMFDFDAMESERKSLCPHCGKPIN